MNPIQVKMEVGKRASAPVEASPHFWSPTLFGIKLAPEDFRDKLHSMDPLLEATWNAHDELWQVWVQDPRVTFHMCRGWRLLFQVKDEKGAYVPLDERTLTKLYLISGARWVNGRQYFESVLRETEREKARVDAEHNDETFYKAGEYFDYATKPKVGYGAISQSKVVGQ